jgi:hypothetical protein
MKKIMILLMLSIFSTACRVLYSPTTSPAAVPEAIVTPFPSAEPTTSPTLAVPTSPTPILTPSPLPALFIQPLINEMPGDPYTSVFTYSMGKNSRLQYIIGDPTNGPNTFAVLPDGGYLISDIDTDRILHFSTQGQLLDIIDLAKLDIHAVIDMRVRNHQLYLVENNSYLVRRMTLDGELLSTESIPFDYRIDERTTIENGLWGIAIDCEGNFILDIAGQLLHLEDVQNGHSPEIADKGYFCNGWQYKTHAVSMEQQVQIKDEKGREIICRTSSRPKGRGADLSIRDVLPDGGVYLSRSDWEIIEGEITVDETIHYLNPYTSVQAMARVPLLEFYTHPHHEVAVGSKGEVFVMIPRATYLEVARLNFYKRLEPLHAPLNAPNMTCATTP